MMRTLMINLGRTWEGIMSFPVRSRVRGQCRNYVLYRLSLEKNYVFSRAGWWGGWRRVDPLIAVSRRGLLLGRHSHTVGIHNLLKRGGTVGGRAGREDLDQHNLHRVDASHVCAFSL